MLTWAQLSEKLSDAQDRNRRLADRRRAELVRDIREGQKEFERGALRPSTPEKIVKEILS